MSGPRQTPLYDSHIAAGGKITDFHGWLLPVQYSGILQEHERVRNNAGLFDVSHMGELEVGGEDAFDFLQGILTNNIGAKPGKAVYSPMCYPDGGTVDDLIVYRLTGGKFLLVVNAANTDRDFQWLQENMKGRVYIDDRSSEYAQLALQGPKAVEILRELTTFNPDSLGYYHYAENVAVGGADVLLSRTGYTGEDGFEIYCRPDDAVKLWDVLMDKGEKYGLKPAGLGARDTLRLEAALPLYGQELSGTISPVMAGLQRFVKPDKGAFIGREPLVAQMEGGLKCKIAGFSMIDRAVPRNGYDVYCNGMKAGYVTSGGFFPTLKRNMGLALLDVPFANEGNTVEVQVRDRLYKAEIVSLPFYKRK